MQYTMAHETELGTCCVSTNDVTNYRLSVKNRNTGKVRKLLMVERIIQSKIPYKNFLKITKNTAS